MGIIRNLSRIDELPSLPEVMFEVQKLTESEKGNANSLAKIIERDPSLSAKILKVVNSSYYCPINSRISSISLAVARLGFNEVRSIVLATNVINHFSGRKTSFGYKAFWKHSIAAGRMCQKITEVSNESYDAAEKEYLFMSGLLHDIGILIYDQFFHELYGQISNIAVNRELSYLEAERQIAGSETHDNIGAALLEIWKLNPYIISSVRYHHRPEKSPEKFKKLSFTVALSEYILCNGSVGSFEGALENVDEDMWENTGISREQIHSLFEVSKVESLKTDAILHSAAGDSSGDLRMI